MRKIKVLHFIRSFEIGGAEKLVVQLAREQKETYNIKIITDEIDIKNPVAIFEISPIPNKKAFLVYGNKIIELKKNKIGQYTNKIGFKRAGEYAIKVKIGDYQQEFNINIKSGFKEEDLF